jgi:hypothetical protein
VVSLGPEGAAKAGAASPIDRAASPLAAIVVMVFFLIFFPLSRLIARTGAQGALIRGWRDLV